MSINHWYVNSYSPFNFQVVRPVIGWGASRGAESENSWVNEGWCGAEGEKSQTEKILPGCRGCKNLHGQVYGGNLLVCGVHPYGQEHCGDYE